MSVRADAETLRQIAIFADCENVHLQVLAFASERQNFAQGAPIIKQGDRAKSAYLILSGTAEIRQRRGLEFRAVAIADPGSLLGEVAMIGRTSYAITAIAKTAVITARIDHDLFLRVASEYPEFGQTVLSTLSQRLAGSVKDFDGVRALFAGGKAFSEL
jgi:CRP/FNR family transcriptional regulator, cyclic AMP receptor protein